MIFFSLTEAPFPDPTQHPETDPKRTVLKITQKTKKLLNFEKKRCAPIEALRVLEKHPGL